MKNEITRRFIHLGRLSRAMFSDDTIELCPREYYGADRRVGYSANFVFDIVQCEGGEVAGEIALRIGDSPAQFYLGHVGYHVDPPFQGHGYALRACRLALPIFEGMGERSFIITTDPDNAASVKTCERLGCEYECTVDVPTKIHRVLEISNRKRRYLYCFPKENFPFR